MSGGWNNGPVREVGELGARAWGFIKDALIAWAFATVVVAVALSALGCSSRAPVEEAPPSLPPVTPPVVVPPPEPPAAPPETACRATEVAPRFMTAIGMFENLPRIVGGTDATVEEYPWMVAITTPFGFQICGGTLIDSTHVLTAAHCKVPPGYHVIAGRTKLSSFEGVRVRVKRSLIHSDYSGAPYNLWDAGLLELETPVTGYEFAKLGAAPAAGVVTAIGWGLLEEGGAVTSDTLKQVTTPIVPAAKCAEAYSYVWDDVQMCAGTGGKDSCQGDSGGPLVWGGKVVGITSHGIGCARPEYPGVYQRTAPLIDWINSCTD